MEHIRQATEQDIPYLYEISLRTALSGLDGTDYFHDPYCVGHYYAAPYFFFEPSLCFIAVDEYNRPSGYIVGTSDTVSFTSWMNSHWLPPLQKHYAHITTFKSENEESIIRLITKGPGEGVWEHVGYPAHLHINLLDNLQGKGLGESPDAYLYGSRTKNGRCRHSPWGGWTQHPSFRILRKNGVYQTETTGMGCSLRHQVLVRIGSPLNLQVFKITGKTSNRVGQANCTLLLYTLLLAGLLHAFYN